MPVLSRSTSVQWFMQESTEKSALPLSRIGMPR